MNDDDNETPFNPEDLDFDALLGGKEESEKFQKDAEEQMLVEAWKDLFILYKGLIDGGFPQTAASEIIASYLYKMAANGSIG